MVARLFSKDLSLLGEIDLSGFDAPPEAVCYDGKVFILLEKHCWAPIVIPQYQEVGVFTIESKLI